jgi:hypothetical protein
VKKRSVALGNRTLLMRSPDLLFFMEMACEVVTGMESRNRGPGHRQVLRASVRHVDAVSGLLLPQWRLDQRSFSAISSIVVTG